MNAKETYIALGLGVATLIAWGGVAFFQQSVQTMEAQLITEAQNAQQSSLQQSLAVRTRAVAQETAPARARLEQVLAVDVGSAATLLQDTGKTTRVAVKLSNALPEAPPSAPAVNSGPSVQAVGFSLEADGTFSALVRTAQLLETLPLASRVERLDIQTGGTAAAPWRMNVYIRVLTTSAISS